MSLTRAQKRMLEWLSTRKHGAYSHGMSGSQIAMLRSMEERWLVARNAHGKWHISQAGRAALTSSGENNG